MIKSCEVRGQNLSAELSWKSGGNTAPWPTESAQGREKDSPSFSCHAFHESLRLTLLPEMARKVTWFGNTDLLVAGPIGSATMPDARESASEFDEVWKMATQTFLQPCLHLCFLAVHDLVD
jgi:hypothetical protein